MQPANPIPNAQANLRNTIIAHSLEDACICASYPSALNNVANCLCREWLCVPCDNVPPPPARNVANEHVEPAEEGAGAAFGVTMSWSEVALRRRCLENWEYEDNWATFTRLEFEVDLARDIFPDGTRYQGFSVPPYVYFTITVEEDVAEIVVQKNPLWALPIPLDICVGAAFCRMPLTQQHFDQGFFDARRYADMLGDFGAMNL